MTLEIGGCRSVDIPAVMGFIGNHWAAGHVLSTSRPLMDWQYKGSRPDEYNWVLARDRGEILGALGYIPNARFDPESMLMPIVWLALWKVRNDARVAGLGLRLLAALQSREQYQAVGVLGINPTHPPMYRALGFTTGELRHHAIFNDSLPQSIACLPEGFPLPPSRAGGAHLIELTDAERLSLNEARWDRSAWQNSAYKPPAYFQARYVDHPFYQYRIYRIVFGGHTQGLLAARIAEAGGGKIMRLVDFSGRKDALSRCGSAIREILLRQELQYADIWEYGLDPEALSCAGFLRIMKEGSVTVPNLFEPFVRTNGRIEFAIKGFQDLDYAIMRGDGDQDRPNRLPS